MSVAEHLTIWTGEPLNHIVADRVARHLGLTPVEVADILCTDWQTLRERDAYLAPTNGEQPAIDFPDLPLGSAKLGFYGPPGAAYVSVLRAFDPHELIPTEAEDGVRKTALFQTYVHWFEQGHRPPPISATESGRGDGLVYSQNRRRVLAARDAGVNDITAWLSLHNVETDIPLKYDDVLQVYLTIIAEAEQQTDPNGFTYRDLLAGWAPRLAQAADPEAELLQMTAEHGRATGHECAAVFDLEAQRAVFAWTSDSPQFVYLPPEVSRALGARSSRYAFVHNHLTNVALSSEDNALLLKKPGIRIMAAISADGAVSRSRRPASSPSRGRFSDASRLNQFHIINQRAALDAETVIMPFYLNGTLSQEEASQLHSVLLNLIHDAKGYIAYDSTLRLPASLATVMNQLPDGEVRNALDRSAERVFVGQGVGRLSGSSQVPAAGRSGHDPTEERSRGDSAAPHPRAGDTIEPTFKLRDVLASATFANPSAWPAAFPGLGTTVTAGDSAYIGLSAGIAGVTTATNAMARSAIAITLFTLAQDIVPREMASGRILFFDFLVDANGDTYDGATIPFRSSGQDLGFSPVISLAGHNPLNATHHEAAHVHLREGRISHEELVAFSDPNLLAKLADRYGLDRYREGRRFEESICWLAGEWGGGHRTTSFADASIEAAESAEVRREQLAIELGLPVTAVTLLNQLVSGEIGQRPTNSAVRHAALVEMGVDVSQPDRRVGPLPHSERVEKIENAFAAALARTDARRAALPLLAKPSLLHHSTDEADPGDAWARVQLPVGLEIGQRIPWGPLTIERIGPRAVGIIDGSVPATLLRAMWEDRFALLGNRIAPAHHIRVFDALLRHFDVDQGGRRLNGYNLVSAARVGLLAVDIRGPHPTASFVHENFHLFCRHGQISHDEIRSAADDPGIATIRNYVGALYPDLSGIALDEESVAWAVSSSDDVARWLASEVAAVDASVRRGWQDFVGVGSNRSTESGPVGGTVTTPHRLGINALVFQDSTRALFDRILSGAVAARAHGRDATTPQLAMMQPSDKQHADNNQAETTMSAPDTANQNNHSTATSLAQQVAGALSGAALTRVWMAVEATATSSAAELEITKLSVIQRRSDAAQQEFERLSAAEIRCGANITDALGKIYRNPAAAARSLAEARLQHNLPTVKVMVAEKPAALGALRGGRLWSTERSLALETVGHLPDLISNHAKALDALKVATETRDNYAADLSTPAMLAATMQRSIVQDVTQQFGDQLPILPPSISPAPVGDIGGRRLPLSVRLAWHTVNCLQELHFGDVERDRANVPADIAVMAEGWVTRNSRLTAMLDQAANAVTPNDHLTAFFRARHALTQIAQDLEQRQAAGVPIDQFTREHINWGIAIAAKTTIDSARKTLQAAKPSADPAESRFETTSVRDFRRHLMEHRIYPALTAAADGNLPQLEALDMQALAPSSLANGGTDQDRGSSQ